MQPHRDISHEGSVDTADTENRVLMSFDQDSISHLMSILTDLYSDPELAVIREYACNAWDSHVEAGNPDPIEITLPSQLNRIYIVKDYGTGMSLDDIMNNFTKYGWSSKRKTNDQVGMLGLGCKSALTYTSQFTFISIYNGLKITVLVTRESDGRGVVQVMDTVSTDEPNGVEVQIPCKDYYNFNSRAKKFFRFWDEGTVLVDGEQPAPFSKSDSILQLDPDVFLTPELGGTDYLVMGNVAYPLAYNKRVFEHNKLSAVCQVPIGVLDFTPSRESLHYTNRTEEVVADARNFIRHAIEQAAQAEMNQAHNRVEVIRVAQKWREAYNGNYSYKGEVVPYSFKVPDPLRSFSWKISKYFDNKAHKLKGAIKYEDAVDALHVVGSTAMSLSPGLKERISIYIRDNGLTNSKTLILPVPLDPYWLADVEAVHIDTLKAIPLESKPAKPKGDKLPRYRWVDTSYNMESWGDVLPAGKLCYILASERYPTRKSWDGLSDVIGRKVDRFDVAAHLHRFHHTLVVVNTTSEKKFLADNPTVPHWRVAGQSEIDSFPAKLSEVELFMINSAALWTDSGLNNLIPLAESVHDSELQNLLRRFKNLDRNSSSWRNVRDLCTLLEVPYPKLPRSTLENTIRRLGKRYGLLREFAYNNHRGNGNVHLLDYVNGVYCLHHKPKPRLQVSVALVPYNPDPFNFNLTTKIGA